jgi:hypothetical protein
LRVGNASGFYGDRFSAMREMLTDGPLDVLTGDYLAELTMLILGRDRMKDPRLGYAKTFLRQMEECLGLALSRGVRVVVNAGGLNPAGLAAALGSLAGDLGLTVRIGHVHGDDLLPRASELGFEGALTANAYLGGWGIAACLDAGADVVVTGRVTDASLLVGACASHFGWARDDWNALAGATVAGHIIECGAQATGGNYSFFTELADLRHPGFPLAEVSADGSAVITKHPGTGGAVTVETVTAQLLYEIGGPVYLGPDVSTDLSSVGLTPDGPDRVRVSGAVGSPPPPDVKVCLNSLGGFRNSMTFVLTGLGVAAKASLVQQQLSDALGDDGPRSLEWTLARTDQEDAATEETASALLHVVAKDADPMRAGRMFTQAAVGMALASYPGFHVTAPPADATPFGVYRAGYVPQDAVTHTAVLPAGSMHLVPAPLKTETPPVSAGAAGFDPAVERALENNPELASLIPGVPDDVPRGLLGRTRRLPLGSIIGARSGDKGGDANLGVWARPDGDTPSGGGNAGLTYRWLRHTLTVDVLRELLPEAADLQIQRYELPNLRALNFVIFGLLGEGVSSSTRFDPQAKALGEWLRARHMEIPEVLL